MPLEFPGPANVVPSPETGWDPGPDGLDELTVYLEEVPFEVLEREETKELPAEVPLTGEDDADFPCG